MDKYIGRMLDNRYEILEVIGSGGMAVVYKARCHRLNRLVAIKILKEDNLDDEDFRRRFHAESQAVAMLSHPNIVSVFDVSSSIMADYIVMELIEGISLKQYMEKKGTLNWKETLHFAMQIAKALEHAHSRGIVHRDIKPHNVMVLKNGSVKVTDFGIARMMSKGNTLTKEALGSVHYISPEQAKGGRVDSRSDIYSLGVVMYEMMTGRPPYDGESPVSVAIKHINGGALMPSLLNSNIPGGLEQIIVKAMNSDIDKRYSDATQMIKDMDEFRKDPTILFDYNAPPLDAVTRLTRPPVTMQPLSETQTDEPVIRRAPPPPPERRTPPVMPPEPPARRTPPERRPAQERRPAPAQTPPPRRREEEKSSQAATIAIIICSLVAVMAIVVFLVILLGGNSSSRQNLYEVPNLVGMEYAEGIQSKYPEFVIIKSYAYSDEYPEGTIYDQKPNGGEKVVDQAELRIFISKGPNAAENEEPILMPNVAGKTESQARTELNALQLGLIIPEAKEEYNETVPAGNVIKTEPSAGTTLQNGQTVTLYVSLGKEIKNGEVPDYMQGFNNDEPMTYEAYVSRVNKLDIKVEIKRAEDEFHDTIPEGYVIKTDPAPGKPIKTGDKITVTVSKGPEMVKIPNVVGHTKETAINMLIGAGFPAPDIEEVESSEAPGTVIGHSELGNLEVPITTKITLQVAKAPEPVSVPVEVTFEWTTPLETDCTLEIKLDGNVVASAQAKAGDTRIKILLTDVGTKTYSVWNGSVMLDDQEVEFTTDGG